MYRYITLYILWYSIFIVYTLLALYICCTPCRILACWLMLSVLHTTLNKDYSILFYSILFYSYSIYIAALNQFPMTFNAGVFVP